MERSFRWISVLSLGVALNACAPSAAGLVIEEEPTLPASPDSTGIAATTLPLTATPTVPEATPTPTAVPVRGYTTGDPTHLRAGPGLDWDVVASLPPQTELAIIGRWLGHDWYLVQWADAPGGQAWVYAMLVVVDGDITTVPAVEVSSDPAPTPPYPVPVAPLNPEEIAAYRDVIRAYVGSGWPHAHPTGPCR